MTFSIIDSIGNTPIVEIKNINPVKGVKIFALHNSTHITAPPSIKAKIKSSV